MIDFKERFVSRKESRKLSYNGQGKQRGLALDIFKYPYDTQC